MVDRRNGALLRQVNRLFGRGTMTGADDGRLLACFVEHGDESAFEALVARFGPMVLGVCGRMLSDPHDIEDAFQATFLILAKKAGGLGNGDLVGNWLYGVAYRVATRTRVNARRRHARESALEDVVAPTTGWDRDWHDVKGVLDEELNRLPEKYRAPLCLCYLQDHSYEEAARRLKCPVGTIRSRLAKARELMRGRLARRGVALPSAAIAAVLGPGLAEAAPSPALVQQTVAVALGMLTTRGAPAGVAALAREVLSTMLFKKFAWTAGALLVVGTATSGALVALQFHPFGDPEDKSPKHHVNPLRAVIAKVEPSPPAERPSMRLSAKSDEHTSAEDRLANLLKQHPAKPSTATDRLGLYLMDIERGEATLVVDQPDPGFATCGSPSWSTNGDRILFDLSRKNDWSSTRIKTLTANANGPMVRELSTGNCASWSPDGKRIAFLRNSGAVSASETGIWMMNADGSELRRVSREYGRLKWSPDGRYLLLVSFGAPTEPVKLRLLDLQTEAVRPLPIEDFSVFSVPSWAGEGTIVAVLGQLDVAQKIALIDVSQPDQGRVSEVLWDGNADPALWPEYPLVPEATGRCVFVGVKHNERALYTIRKGPDELPQPLEPGHHDHFITDLTSAPEGRYLLFCSDRR